VSSGEDPGAIAVCFWSQLLGVGEKKGAMQQGRPEKGGRKPNVERVTARFKSQRRGQKRKRASLKKAKKTCGNDRESKRNEKPGSNTCTLPAERRDQKLINEKRMAQVGQRRGKGVPFTALGSSRRGGELWKGVRGDIR